MGKSAARKRKRKRGAHSHPGHGGHRRAERRSTSKQAEALLAAIQSMVEEVFDEETSSERCAELLTEIYPTSVVPVGLSLMLGRVHDDEHARTVSERLTALAPGTAAALTLAAEVSQRLDEDFERAARLLDEATAVVDAEGRASLAAHLLACRRVAEAVTLATERMRQEPGDGYAVRVQAGALGMSASRMEEEREGIAIGRCPCESGKQWDECCKAVEERALRDFADRGPLYELRSAMSEFLAGHGEIEARVLRKVTESLEDELDVAGDEDFEGLASLLAEHAWIVGESEQLDEETRSYDVDAPLALFAAKEEESEGGSGLGAAAKDWLTHASYGLWQIDDPHEEPGVWLTDIVSGVRRFVAAALEQLEGLPRWSVLLCALVPIDGVWRTGGTVVVLSPTEGDYAAETVEYMTKVVVSSLRGSKQRVRKPRAARPKPYGALASELEPMAPEMADMSSKVVGGGLAEIALGAMAQRRARPQLQNTDGDPLCIVKAKLLTKDPVGVERSLADHPDIEREEDALTWWGRALSEMEQETALAELRSHLRENGEESALTGIDGPKRWLRGRLRRSDDGFEVDVNSKERLQRLLDLFAELGEEPVVSEKLVIDPAEDLPFAGGRPMLPLGASAETNETWAEHWPDESLPALGGLSPRRAAERVDDRPRLEALLRELEHDADLVAAKGLPCVDVGALREELGMG